MADLDAILADPAALRDSIASLERAAADAANEATNLAAEADRLRQRSDQKQREASANAEMVRAFRFRLELLTGETPEPAAESPSPAPTAPAPGSSAPRRSRSDGTAGDEVLKTLTQLDRPVKIADVHAALPDLAKKTVGWWLWRLATDGKITRVKQGIYAPLSYTPDEPAPASPLVPIAEGDDVA
jgi:hypothetical protein